MSDSKRVKWGILSTAKIAREKVIPAMQKSDLCEVLGIASSNTAKVQEIAAHLSIPVIYNSYEELLADKNIDAVYIPLPNHLHVQWAMNALKAGKHVLCEKPIGLTAEEATKLLELSEQFPQLVIMEAFMYKFHSQWKKVQGLVKDGKIGELKLVQSFFSYFNIDPVNIRNRKDAGGGGLMDIGCYCISFARLLFGSEPRRVLGIADLDPVMQTDRMLSAIMDFGDCVSTFTCSTQLMPYQRVNIIGTEGRIEVMIPVNAPPDKETRIVLFSKTGEEEFIFPPEDQYTSQVDAFCMSVLNHKELPFSLEDSIGNMKVIESIFQSSQHAGWVNL